MCEEGTESLPKLYFFWGTGRGELARLILIYVEAKFEDLRCKYLSDEWKELRPKTPLGYLPVYEEGGVQIGGSTAIARYLGEKHNLASSVNWENALLASYVDALMAFIPKIFSLAHAKEEEKPGMIEVFLKNEPEKLKVIEHHIKEDLTFLGNGKTTYAEITVCYICCNIKKYKLDLTLTDTPRMRAICQKIDEIPRIRNYREERGDIMKIVILQIVLLSLTSLLVSITDGLNIMIASGCFWDEVGPNLAVAEELLILGHAVVYASPAECNAWINEYYGVEKLDTDGPGESDMRKTINEYMIETGYGEDTFLSYEADYFLIYRYCDMYQTIHDYLNKNKIDVMFVSFNAIGALFAAEKTGTPVLMNYNSIVLTRLTEYCQQCGYTQALPRLYYSGYLHINLLQEFMVSISWNLAPILMWRIDSIINSKRKEIGLKSYFPKSAILQLQAIYPKVYPMFHPLLRQGMNPPEGRWIVGPLIPKLTGRELNTELEQFITVSDKPVVLISFSELLQLDDIELRNIFNSFTNEKGYRVIWLIDYLQQEILAKFYNNSSISEQKTFNDNLLIEHPSYTRELVRDKKIDLVVTTAGYSYIVEAFVHNKPMILIPVLYEQERIAELIDNLRCGEMLSRSDISDISSSIEDMLVHRVYYNECLEGVKEGISNTRGARLVVEILERMAVKTYVGMNFSFQKSSVPDLINSILAIVLLLLQGALLLLLSIYIIYMLFISDWNDTDKPDQKDKVD
ncbi:Glutathione S-transferase sigma [Oopsacas minuta]|uniref:glutathione transferase n=1 Tax=Oopsacas minuta TaxID=111878 RepID=A0AAV7K589_9METZ|nr:Glutathione S-transferase sigma [Oopsacas minuta]